MNQPNSEELKPEWMKESQSPKAPVQTGANNNVSRNRAGRAKPANRPNPSAPQLVRVKREPPRKQKAFYIQDIHSDSFETLVFMQKRALGKKAPELAEEAIELLLKKYGAKLESRDV